MTSVAAERSSSSWLSLNSSQWIRGPVYDAVFFCALWRVPVSVLILGTTTAMASAVFFILYHLFIRVPHFAATANFTYFYQANREYDREHWIRYMAVPVVIVAAYAARPWFESRSIYNNLLLSVATIWGMQHIAAQNFGVLESLSRTFGGESRQPLAIARKGCVLRTDGPRGLRVRAAVVVVRARFINSQRVRWVIRLAVVLTCGAYVARIWTRRAVAPVSIPALLYFATAVSVMVPWPIYKRLPQVGAGAFFYVFNGQHCLAYLGLVFHMKQ